ncbi:hypothetical protein [Streptomyces sp. NPDC017941]|uniref:hypothetical protein n=1 Tax=Streptomyces sp. NPDC017941 TaxID=3365018 RepID=UPI003788AA81
MDPIRPENARQLPPHLRALIADVESAYRFDQPAPVSSFRDETPVPKTGETDTPPVPQPDTRVVPSWATGLAVGSVGVGAGATGLGCAAWLAFKGLALVSVPSLQTFALILLAPFAGIALAAVGIGAALARAKRAHTTNVFKGSVHVTHKTAVNSTARGMFARNRNDVRPS